MERKAVWAGLAYTAWRDGLWHLSQVGDKCTDDVELCPWRVEYPTQRQKYIADSSVALECGAKTKEKGGIFKKCYFQQVFKHSDLGNRLYRGKGPRFFFVCSGSEGDAERVGKLKPLRENNLEPVYVPVNVPKNRLWSDAAMFD